MIRRCKLVLENVELFREVQKEIEGIL